MTKNKKNILAMLWNWNHKFFGMKESGVYLAVRILFLVYVCFGSPVSSLNSSGRGWLKNRILPSPSSLEAELCASSRSTSSSGSLTLSSRDPWLVPDCLFFSVEVVRLCILSIIDTRFVPPLLIVNFLVAHLERLGVISSPLSPLSPLDLPLVPSPPFAMV